MHEIQAGCLRHIGEPGRGNLGPWPVRDTGSSELCELRGTLSRFAFKEKDCGAGEDYNREQDEQRPTDGGSNDLIIGVNEFFLFAGWSGGSLAHEVVWEVVFVQCLGAKA